VASIVAPTAFATDASPGHRRPTCLRRLHGIAAESAAGAVGYSGRRLLAYPHAAVSSGANPSGRRPSGPVLVRKMPSAVSSAGP